MECTAEDECAGTGRAREQQYKQCTDQTTIWTHQCKHTRKAGSLGSTIQETTKHASMVGQSSLIVYALKMTPSSSISPTRLSASHNPAARHCLHSARFMSAVSAVKVLYLFEHRTWHASDQTFARECGNSLIVVQNNDYSYEQNTKVLR